MMPSIGIYLLYAAVALRGALVFAEDQRLTLVLILFGAYGLLLLVEPWITRIKFPSFTKIADQTFFAGQMWRPLLYIILQTSIVMALMAIPETQDFFALLFVPLSLKAILFFGRRLGYVCITIFSILMIIPLLGSEDGTLFGFVMGVFFSGMCFLFGGYAHQVQRAEAARSQNQQIYNELQIAHRQLQLYTDQAAVLAVEQERNRLARDLHDSVTQTVFSMNLTTQSARLLWNKEPPTALEQLFHLEELAANALSEIQNLVLQLRPRSLVEGGLPTALQSLAAQRQAREGLCVTLQISEKDFLSEEEAGGLYAIAYEALTNIIKHSGSREATIRLSLDKGESLLEIEDQGCGFDPTEMMGQSGHLGLAGMSERAREIGWILSISSRPQQGTQIRVTKNCPIGSE
jgi:signal transduction histidine kinase